jgi:hypothetical protein
MTKVVRYDEFGGVDGVTDRIKAAAPNGIHAFIDTYGGGYVVLRP